MTPSQNHHPADHRATHRAALAQNGTFWKAVSPSSLVETSEDSSVEDSFSSVGAESSSVRAAKNSEHSAYTTTNAEPKTLTVAMLTVNPCVGDVMGNTRAIEGVIRRALDNDPTIGLCVLPELAVSGYLLHDLPLSPDFPHQCEDALAHLISRLTDISCDVVLGCPLPIFPSRHSPLPARAHLVTSPDDHEPSGYVRAINAAVVMTRRSLQSGQPGQSGQSGWDLHVYPKRLLPNYGPFNEPRSFVQGRDSLMPKVHVTRGVRWAPLVCEDLWYGHAATAAVQAGATLLCVLNGSPFEVGKPERRLTVAQRVAQQTGATIVYVNLSGSQDGVVFDGHRFFVQPNGSSVASLVSTRRSPTGVAPTGVDKARVAPTTWDDVFTSSESTLVRISGISGILGVSGLSPATTVQAPSSQPLPTQSAATSRLGQSEAVIYAALLVGLRDYVRKNGFTDVLIGVSGGMDSALVAALAVDALGSTHVHAVQMPTHFNSERTRYNATDLIGRLGLSSRTVALDTLVATAHNTIWGALPSTDQQKIPALARENLQSRLRGLVMMSEANRTGAMLLTTGNKSEVATGYFTLYGDSCGGFAPLADVYKTDIFTLGRWRNTLRLTAQPPQATPPIASVASVTSVASVVAPSWVHAPALCGPDHPIPDDIFDTPPSAELAPDQRDSDSLPSYDVLDPILYWLIEQRGDPAHAPPIADEPSARQAHHELVERVRRLIRGAEHKRFQIPPCTKISPMSWRIDRIVPLTQQLPPSAPLYLTHPSASSD